MVLEQFSIHIRLAASLPPVFLFCGSRDGNVHAVAGFVQKTLVCVANVL